MKNNSGDWLEDFDPTAAGSRTSTPYRADPNARARARALAERLARGLGPIHLGYYNGALQRGNTPGKHKWETKRETKMEEKWKKKKRKNEKWKKKLFNSFKSMCIFI